MTDDVEVNCADIGVGEGEQGVEEVVDLIEKREPDSITIRAGRRRPVVIFFILINSKKSKFRYVCSNRLLQMTNNFFIKSLNK